MKFKLPIPRTEFVNINSLFHNYIDILHNVLFPNDYSVNYSEGPYEIPELRLTKGDVVIDAGANMGLFSAHAASKGCFVHAFEPDSRVMEYLNRVVELNPGMNIKVVASALSNISSQSNKLFLSHQCGGSTMFKQDLGYLTGEEVSISTTRLDDYVISEDLRSVDFIKADIEGFEEELLQGSYKTIMYFKPKLSLCTYHKQGAPATLEKLILDIEPRYNIIHRYLKLYAWCEK